MKKPNVLDKDKEKFQRFLGWASPYSPLVSIFKLRRALRSFRLSDRWIEFMYSDKTYTDKCEEIKGRVGAYLVQGILSLELYRYGDREDFDIVLRDVHIEGKPVIAERRINKLIRPKFSAKRIWEENHKRW